MNTPKKFSFISTSGKSYLAEYLNLSRKETSKDYSFKKLDLNALIEYNPEIVVVDLYFSDNNYSKLAEMIRNAFPKSFIYILSPEYADYNGLMRSLNNPNHYYSNFSGEILNHINMLISGDLNNNYQEAS